MIGALAIRVQERTRLKNRRPADEPLERFTFPLRVSARNSVLCKAITSQFVRPQDVCFLGGYVSVPELYDFLAALFDFPTFGANFQYNKNLMTESPNDLTA